MPLTLVRSRSNARLWGQCVDAFLPGNTGAAGTDATRHGAHLWLTHRTTRDRLLETAAARGHPGWLAPPFSFFSELPVRFDLPGRPLGPLTGRMLLTRISADVAEREGFGGERAPARGHMIDRLLSDLLPEGVAPDDLAAALETIPRDAFRERRDRWIVETYRRYLARSEERGQYDPRSVHARIADRVRDGALPAAIGGATALHVFGPASLQGRRRLFGALAAQDAVEVRVYLPDEADPGEWERVATGSEALPDDGPPALDVQPTPDAIREADWIARAVKGLVSRDSVPLHQIAIVARSGREDTRRIHDALGRAGIPATARIRTRLDEVPALRAVLLLLEAIADEWPRDGLRAVLGSPYFATAVDLRGIDLIATRARPRGIDAWIRALEGLREELSSDRAWRLARAGVSRARLADDLAALETLRSAVDALTAPRPESEWIAATRDLLRGRPLGLRELACVPAGERWDLVRLDQRGILAVDALLREWLDLAPDGGRPVPAGEWTARLRQLLQSNELALSTPGQRGVQVLEAHEAALTPFAHTFIVHANDGVFPAPFAGGLLTDDERVQLVAAGVPVQTRDLRLEREQRLWRACANGAAVTVTYRTADSRGVPRLASLFVPSHDRRGDLPRTRAAIASTGDDAGLTRTDVLGLEVLRLAGARRGRPPEPFTTPDPHAIRAAVLGAFADAARTGGLDPFAETVPLAPGDAADAAEALEALFGNARPLSERPGPWNGRLRDPALLDWLGRRFGDDREWSASQLEQYARRPFDFLLERVLGLTDAETAEDEANRLTVGGLVHAALETFYRGFVEGPDRVDPAVFARDGLPEDEVDRRFAAAWSRVCDAYETAEDRWVGAPCVWAATREELAERIHAFLTWELARRDRGAPWKIELAFGRGGAAPAADLSGPGRDGSPRHLLLAGRIDRIDRLGPDGTGDLRIVDYKSGGASGAPSKRAFDDGAALQATLYMAAADALGLGRPISAVYRTVRAPANRGTRGPGDVESSLRLAREIPPRVRAGLFEAVQAGSGKLLPWQPGRDIARTEVRISSGTRFDRTVAIELPAAEGATT